MRRALGAAGAGFALALVAAVAVGPAAWGHDQLVDADPGEGDTVSSATEVTLTFSASLLGASDETANLAQVTGPDGLHYETACATVDGAAMTVPVELGPAGEYTVAWRVVSSDGHPVSGDYAFDYVPEGEPNAAAAAEVSACPAVATSGEAAASSDDGSGTGLVIGLVAGGVVLAGLAVLLVIAMRRRPVGGSED